AKQGFIITIFNLFAKRMGISKGKDKLWERINVLVSAGNLALDNLELFEHLHTNPDKQEASTFPIDHKGYRFDGLQNKDNNIYLIKADKGNGVVKENVNHFGLKNFVQEISNIQQLETLMNINIAKVKNARKDLLQCTSDKFFRKVHKKNENFDRNDLADLQSELKILTHVGENENIVNILGACTKVWIVKVARYNFQKLSFIGKEACGAIQHAKFEHSFRHLRRISNIRISDLKHSSSPLCRPVCLRKLNRCLVERCIKKGNRTSARYCEEKTSNHELVAYRFRTMRILRCVGNARNFNFMKLNNYCKSSNLCIIMEYCPNGNLREFLRNNRSRYNAEEELFDPDLSQVFGPKSLIYFAWQITKGMTFLASRKIIHRDLAARNILLGLGYVAKIADFGLARDVYKNQQYLRTSTVSATPFRKGLVPFKWMAVESIKDSLFTEKSDVERVVIWYFTLGNLLIGLGKCLGMHVTEEITSQDT
ncbi:vascular endothelial growth factor receptor 2-like, partial [Paramuricea clavata]